MTAYAAFQNQTEWSFQKWKEELECYKNAKSRHNNNKRAQRALCRSPEEKVKGHSGSQ